MMRTPPIDTTGVAAQLERVKWFLWHGNVPRALETVDDLEADLEVLPAPGARGRKLLKVLDEFRGYIAINRAFIPNYGDRYRHGELISTAFAEATINQVVSRRMVKKQQMRWTESGAHHLLQLRTKVLNDELRQAFVRWYPGMRSNTQEPLRASGLERSPIPAQILVGIGTSALYSEIRADAAREAADLLVAVL